MLLDAGAGPDGRDSLLTRHARNALVHACCACCTRFGRVYNPISCVMSHMGVCIIVNERGDGCVHNDGIDFQV